MNQNATIHPPKSSYNKLLFIFSFIICAGIFLPGRVAAQYCTPQYFNGCSFQDDIDDFTLTGAGSSSISDLGTGCTTGGYADRTAVVPAVNLQQGGTYSGTVLSEYSGDEYVRIWIDFNNDQVFADTESVAAFGPVGNTSPVSFTMQLPFNVPVANNLRMRVRLAYFATPANTIDPCNYYSFGETHDYKVNILATPACTGTPTAGTITPAGPFSACAGTVYNFTATGTTFATGLTYQWQQSTNGGSTWTSAAGGSGSNTLFYTTPPLLSSIKYRLKLTCNSTAAFDTSAPVTITVAPPTYAALPHTEGFENWMNYCDVSDVPSSHWLNKPVTGDASWRRDDQGATANWLYPPGGAYTPASVEGSHSARFHTFFVNYNDTGTLDLFVDCSAPGTKELQFYHTNGYGSDPLDILLSTDAGLSFTNIGTFYTTNGWQLETIPFTSTSATTIIRFKATSDYSDDIGIDAVKVLLPCSGTPNAGTVNPLTPCSGVDFALSLSNSTVAGGLTYQWQDSTAASGAWNNTPGANSMISTGNITVPTWFRCIVTCTNGTAPANADTTPVQFFDLATFYYCYCQSTAQYPNDEDLGNVSIRPYPSGTTLLNNGVANPLTFNTTSTNTYTNFTNLPPTHLYKGSKYYFSATQICENYFYQSYAAMYIDYNRDGQYDTWERVFLKATSDLTTPAQQVGDTMTVPDTAHVGITGMRVILSEGTWSVPMPCGSYYAGETEDYLVHIDYPPCTGAPDAGLARISDTLICPGFTVKLTDTTHQFKNSGLSWEWEASTDGVNWATVPNSAGRDTLTVTVSVATYYRFKIFCSFTNQTTYSAKLHVSMRPFYQCYCLSYADGGTADVTDIGAFSIGNFVTNTGGPHLSNPNAYHRYTDYTGAGIATLYADSSYDVSAYHIMSSAAHMDAKITLFIDLNNNEQYDAPDERLWTGYTDAGNVYIHSLVDIPATATTGVLTGMRLIINNDLAPSVASDEACGTYTSGETEDYLVMLMNKNSAGIGQVSNVRAVVLFPNPTDGKCQVQLEAATEVKHLEMSVTDMTGREVIHRSYEQPGRHFSTDVDLGNQSRGVYFITLKADGEKIVRKLVVR
jgi:hypothetical protein